MSEEALVQYKEVREPAYHELCREIDGVNWACYEVMLSSRKGNTYAWLKGNSFENQTPIDGDDFEISQIASAFANEQRVRIMRTIYAGYHTFGELKEQTGLNAGQLQHHLKELALVSFLQGTSQRNHYELSNRGKALLLLMVCMGKWQPNSEDEAFLTPEGVESAEASA